jgi:hypothetical protein
VVEVGVAVGVSDVTNPDVGDEVASVVADAVFVGSECTAGGLGVRVSIDAGPTTTDGLGVGASINERNTTAVTTTTVTIHVTMGSGKKN